MLRIDNIMFNRSYEPRNITTVGSFMYTTPLPPQAMEGSHFFSRPVSRPRKCRF